MKDATAEADIQRLIVSFLRLLGYTVLETSRHRKRCRGCGRWPAGGDGCDRGLPDLLVAVPKGGGMRRWLGLEVKGAETRLSPEQQALAAAGLIVIVRTPEEALAAVRGGET